MEEKKLMEVKSLLLGDDARPFRVRYLTLVTELPQHPVQSLHIPGNVSSTGPTAARIRTSRVYFVRLYTSEDPANVF